MVNLFTKCNGCANYEACLMRFDLEQMIKEIDNIDYKYRPHNISAISINIKCNKYQTDYGKGLGK